MDFAQPPAVLDLCVRKRPASPDFYAFSKRPPSIYVDPSFQYSPTSNNSDSDAASEKSETSSTKNFSPYSCGGGDSLSTKLFSTTPKKCPRPFKAYIRDPISLAAPTAAIDSNHIFRKDSNEAYCEFRSKVLSGVQNSNGTNKNMRRMPPNPPQGKIEDPTYWEKRRKNNEAAKRSRDARRAKEDEIAIRCAFLEQENLQLKFRLAALESERNRLQSIVYPG